MNTKAAQYKDYLLETFRKRQGNQTVSPLPDNTTNPLPGSATPESGMGTVGKTYFDATNAISGMRATANRNLLQLGTKLSNMNPFKKPMAAAPTPTSLPTPMPTPMPTSTPMPTPNPGNDMFFNYKQYKTSNDSYMPNQPPPHLAKLLNDEFPNEATKAAIAAGTESGFNENAYNFNPQGGGAYKDSHDYGLFQINNVTLADFQRRFPNQVASMGIKTVEDLRDPVKSTKLAKLIRDKQGWGAWYGPKNRGFNLN